MLGLRSRSVAALTSPPIVSMPTRALAASADLTTQLRASTLRGSVVVVVYAAVNIGLLLSWDIVGSHQADWTLWEGIGTSLTSGTLYTADGLPYLWSPLLAPVMALVGIVGLVPWAVVHVATLALLRDWRLIGLLLVSLGFWTNVVGGNTFTFVVVAAILALRGSRGWAMVYLALLFLMPRPVQVPIGLLLLWRMPEIRLPTLAVFVAHAAAVLATGYADDWLQVMVSLGVPVWSVGPSYWLGLSWLVIGVPLGLVLLWRGHPGWAGLAWTSYWLPHYFLIPMTEDRRSLVPLTAVVLLGAISASIVWATRGG